MSIISDYDPMDAELRVAAWMEARLETEARAEEWAAEAEAAAARGEPLAWQFNDGGRSAAEVECEDGMEVDARDCVCRSVAIVTGRPYAEIHAALAAGNAAQRVTKRIRNTTCAGQYSADFGIVTSRLWFKRLMHEWGFRWTPTTRPHSDRAVHLRAAELPHGRLVALVGGHAVAVIDGLVHDTHDPTRGGRRLVYGIWRLEHEHDR